jgi:flagellar FliL protein
MSKEAIEEKVEEEKNDSASGSKEESKPSKKGKVILLILFPVVLLLLGVGLYFSGALNGFLKKDPPHQELPPAEQAAAAEPIYKSLEEFLVDLKTGSSASFIKIEVVLKLTDQASLKAVDESLPIIRDSFISYLRELKSTDIYGSEGLFVLKQELLMRINKIISPSSVEDIYIQNILTR